MSDSMKILMVNTEYQRGGAAGIARALHRELSRLEGFESLFAYGRGAVAQEPGTVRFAFQAEMYLHALLTRATGIQGYGTWLSTRRLIKLIRDWKPDIIHFHNIHGYYLDLSIAEVVGRLGIPVVWTLHDAWPLSGRCAHFLDCERWKTGCGKCPYLREYPKAYFDSSAWMWPRKRRLLGGVWNPVIVSPSRWLASLVKEACNGRCRVEVIPHGIDTGVFRPYSREQVRKELGLPLEKKIVLFAAAKLTAKLKGIDYFFEALNFVKVDNVMVLLVGGEVDMGKKPPASIELRSLGYVRDVEVMAKVYSAVDIFCITSLSETFGLVVTEAMACGIPIVGFAVGGISEQVAEGCGKLVSLGDTRALGEAITNLLKDDVARERMGSRCRERAEQEYSLQRFVERHVALYRKVVGSKCSETGG